jgi:hypothetical protein
MEQMYNREKFLEKFDYFINLVELNESLLDSLRGFPSFSKNMMTVEV